MIQLSQLTQQLSPSYQFYIEQLSILPAQHCAIVGPNGSGKSALAATIAGQGEVKSGKRQIQGQVGWVSVEQQKALIEQERQRGDADILDTIPTPSSVLQVLEADICRVTEQPLFDRLCQIFRLAPLLNRDFLALSTGETRKVLLTREILKQPEILVLDEPWDGLDTDACEQLNVLFKELSESMTFIVIINRLSEMPPFIARILYMQEGELVWQSQGESLTAQDRAHLHQLMHMQNADLIVPARDEERFSPKRDDPSAPLVILRDGQVSYPDNKVFEHLDWQIDPLSHWQVTGPNGSGKTCLLNMLTGDNSHCYTNDLTIFGYQRGSGESIWDIKKHIGFVSNALHMQYRVNCSLLDVLLSGFYDSIGLYEQPSAKQKQLAREWVRLIGLESQVKTPFQRLSFGDQRMALIARAMVKHPSLLILDEPTNGLDEINRLKVLTLVGLLARQGESTILYVNHHQEDSIAGIENKLDMADYQAS